MMDENSSLWLTSLAPARADSFAQAQEPFNHSAKYQERNPA